MVPLLNLEMEAVGSVIANCRSVETLSTFYHHWKHLPASPLFSQTLGLYLQFWEESESVNEYLFCLSVNEG